MRPSVTLAFCAFPFTHAWDKHRGTKLVGYYTQWSSGQIANIQAGRMTHLAYAFAKIDPSSGEVIPIEPFSDTQQPFGNGDECECCAKGKYNQLFQLRKRAPHLQILLSIGGAGEENSGPFVAATQSAQARQKLVKSTMKLVRDYGFDGVDLDWEYPENPTEVQQYIDLMYDFRQNIEGTKNSATILSAAVSANVERLETYNLPVMLKVLDWMSIMLYDYSSGNPVARHHAALYKSSGDPTNSLNSSHVIARIIQMLGAEAALLLPKIVFGFPTYGHRFVQVAPGQFQGLYQPKQDHPEQRTMKYSDIVNLKGRNGYDEIWDEESKSHYIYNTQTQEFITYESPQSLAEKIAYVQQKRLGGMMYWEYDQDPEGVLTGLAASQLGILRTENFQANKCPSTSPFGNINCQIGTSCGHITSAQANNSETRYGYRKRSEDFGFGKDEFEVVYVDDEEVELR